MSNLRRGLVANIAICLVGLFGTIASQAAGAAGDRTGCREITRQVALWPKAAHPGKALRAPMFETRRAIICDKDSKQREPAGSVRQAR